MCTDEEDARVTFALSNPRPFQAALRDRMQGHSQLLSMPRGLLLMHQGCEYISDCLFERLSARVRVVLDPAVLGYKAQERVVPGPEVSSP